MRGLSIPFVGFLCAVIGQAETNVSFQFPLLGSGRYGKIILNPEHAFNSLCWVLPLFSNFLVKGKVFFQFPLLGSLCPPTYFPIYQDLSIPFVGFSEKALKVLSGLVRDFQFPLLGS